MGVLASNRRQQRAQPRAPLLILAPLRPARPAALTLDLALTLTPPPRSSVFSMSDFRPGGVRVRARSRVRNGENRVIFEPDFRLGGVRVRVRSRVRNVGRG
jgi:hypothetical protein